MNVLEGVTLFATLAMLAAVPSASVALVVARSATRGVGNGVAVAAGIVLADLLFIALVLLGLTVLAEVLGGLFLVVRYVGALYLLWLGISLLRAASVEAPADASVQGGGLLESCLAGFLLTLGDIKAIFFYLSLLPLFIDLTTVQWADVASIAAITVLAVGGTKLCYVLSAQRLMRMLRGGRWQGVTQKAAGAALVGAGGYLAVKA